MQNVIIFGTGPLARLLHHLIETTTTDKVAAFTVDAEYKNGSEFEGKPVYAYEELEQRIATDGLRFICAVGYSSMRMRQQVFLRLKTDGRLFYSYISPSAVIDSSVMLGDNTIIFANVVIEPFCVLGDNNLFWSSCILCHDTKVGDNNFFAANSTIGGFCHIGNNCFFAFSSVITQNLTIEDESLIGASAVLLQSTARATKYLGNPARDVSRHSDIGITL
ncbi:MAG: acetyltransferase [Gammaproteobacteria bacterium]|nr:acetyltransferase [Gammaproteobacteria bacterium]